MGTYNPDDYVDLALSETSSEAIYGKDNQLVMREFVVIFETFGSTHAYNRFFIRILIVR